MPVVRSEKNALLFVGAFPPAGSTIVGGMVSACRALLGSSFSEQFDLDLIDTTQISNPPPPLPMRILLAIPRVGRFIHHLESRRPDCALMFAAPGASLIEKGLMAWYARWRGVPAILFPRGGAIISDAQRSRFWRAVTRFAFNGAHVVPCQGPSWQDFIASHSRHGLRDMPVVPNWTASTRLLAIGQDRIDGRLPRDSRHLIFVGWLDDAKGVPELVEATLELARRHAFRLTFVGEGNASQAARQRIEQAGLDDRIAFAGWKSRAEIDALLATGDIFVLPSHDEGFPNALVEAMAAGLAPVITPVGAIPDIIRDGENGLLVPVGDASALAQALASLLDGPELKWKLAQNAHHVARTTFAVESAVATLAATINRVIAEMS